jgi:hypothetical protein
MKIGSVNVYTAGNAAAGVNIVRCGSGGTPGLNEVFLRVTSNIGSDWYIAISATKSGCPSNIFYFGKHFCDNFAVVWNDEVVCGNFHVPFTVDTLSHQALSTALVLSDRVFVVVDYNDIKVVFSQLSTYSKKHFFGDVDSVSYENDGRIIITGLKYGLTITEIFKIDEDEKSISCILSD